jgi:methionyl-tRNA formyltransferase
MDVLTNSSATLPRVVFMGTPALAAELLEALLAAGFPVVGVVTKPDKPVGRDQKLLASPVKEVALAAGIPVLTPVKIDGAAIEAIADFSADVIVVAAYGKILPQALLDIPRLGCLNVHYSLLPRFRGASPIQHALLFGDTLTGVTLMRMDAGLDTGDIIATRNVAIAPDDTSESLTPKLTAAAKALVLKALPLWATGNIVAAPQTREGVVLCQLIERSDGQINFEESAEAIYNRYRAFTPWPGIFTHWKKKDVFLRIKLLDILPLEVPHTDDVSLGQVFLSSDGPAVQTASGALLLKTVQLEGKPKMLAKDFLNGNPDFIGAFLV